MDGLVDRKYRSLARCAFGEQCAVVLVDDGVGNGQSDSGAFSDLFGGEKRVENTLEVFGSDALAGIAHLNEAEVAGVRHFLFFILAPGLR